MAISTIAAIGTLLGGAGAVAGALGRGQNTAGSNLDAAQLQDARNNEAYQRALSALINQRSTAGFTDAFGSQLRYDPATNQWVSTLGALPMAEQTAASQAAISRNTTDLRMSQLANEMAMRRAAAAQPAADSARRALENFRPMSADELGGLLSQQGVIANNNVIRPIIADTLRNFSRTGTGAGDVLSKLGRTSYENLRDVLTNSRIQALQNVSGINAQNRQGLEGAATTTANLANPNLQFSGIQPSDVGKTMASLMAGRAQTASTAPAYGAAGTNTATSLGNTATDALTKNLPDPNFGLNQGISAVDSLSSLLKDKNLGAQISKLFGGSSFNPAGGLTNQAGTSPGFGDRLFQPGGVF